MKNNQKIHILIEALKWRNGGREEARENETKIERKKESRKSGISVKAAPLRLPGA